MTPLATKRTRYTTLLVALGLVAAACAIYSNTLNAPFVFDDHSSILNNGSIRRLWPLDAGGAGGTRGRPVANASYALNYAWGKTGVAGYHLTNIAIHAAAALMLFGLVRRTLLLPVLEEKFAARATAIGGIAALLWEVHPLQTEAVTYLSQRTESLMGLCYLATLYCFVRSVVSASARGAWLGLAVLACFAGMASKEVMITAPVMVFLYDRTFVAGSFASAWRTRSRFYLGLASSWVVLAWLMVGTANRGVGFRAGVDPLRYAATESRVVLQYLKLAFWPSPLVFDYGSNSAHSLAGAAPYLLVVGAMVLGIFAALRFRPMIGFLLAWPFLLLAPTSSLVPVALQPMAEHRMYLPLAGLIIGVLFLVDQILPRKTWLFVFVGAAFAVGTYRRNSVYESEATLWSDTVKKAPDNSRAYLNLGTAYLNLHQRPEARACFEKALALDPQEPKASVNLGVLCVEEGQPDQAIAHFEAAIRADPGLAEAYYNLGCALLKTGRVADAGRALSQAVQINPDYADAHNNLAIILVAAGRLESAIEHYSEALRVNPEDAEIHANRAEANLKLGRRDVAIADYEASLRLKPGLESARRQLEILLSSPSPAKN